MKCSLILMCAMGLFVPPLMGQDTTKDEFYLLNFKAKWCTPCKKMAKYKNDRQVKGSLKQYKLGDCLEYDADNKEHKAIFKEFKVQSIPTLIILDKNRKVVKRANGYMTLKQFQSFIKEPSKPVAQGEEVQEFGDRFTLKGILLWIFRGILYLIG